MTAKRKRHEAPRKQGGYLTQKEMQPTRPGKDKPAEPGETPATTPDGAAATNPDDANEPRRGGSREL
jgi:hypothetical protein